MFVFTLKKKPEYLNFCKSDLFIPFVAVETKSSLLFFPPKVQLVIFPLHEQTSQKLANFPCAYEKKYK